MNKRIFDCFPFFNELDLLEVRLNTLGEHVDHFVLVESTQTFQGAPKPLHYEANKARFARWADKIIHVVVDDMPDVTDSRLRDQHQRRSIKRGLVGLQPEDVVIVDDADEIMRPSTIDFLRAHSGYFLIEMPMFQFYLNMQATGVTWNKVFAYSWRLDPKVRDYNYVRVLQQQTFDEFAGDNHLIKHAGWHFTFLGGAERVREKVRAYAHHGGVLDLLLAEGGAEQYLASGHDLGGRLSRRVEIDEYFPAYIRENLAHFESLGFVKSLRDRVVEIEAQLAASEQLRRSLVMDGRALLDEVAAATSLDDLAGLDAKYRDRIDGAWRLKRTDREVTSVKAK